MTITKEQIENIIAKANNEGIDYFLQEYSDMLPIDIQWEAHECITKRRSIIQKINSLARRMNISDKVEY